MRYRILCAVLFTSINLAGLVSTANAQNIVSNGAFNSNLNGWSSANADVSVTWTGNDADASNASGSILASNNSPTALDSGFVQCVDGVTGGVSYNFSAKMLIPSTNPAGRASVQIQWNDQAGCAGTFLLAEILESGIRDSWSSIGGTDNAPAAAKSALIFGEVYKNSTASVSFQTSFDDIVLEPSTSFTGLCSPSATVLCIDDQPGDHRFQISVNWNDPEDGNGSGAGQAVQLASLGVTHGGLFWFFSGDNPEMLVKVLNGCGVNHHHWVFFAADTNVGFTVTVIDTIGGVQRTYSNPVSHAATPLQDTSAFACP